jgi:hypothetical protein
MLKPTVKLKQETMVSSRVLRTAIWRLSVSWDLVITQYTRLMAIPKLL